jgi:phosphoribosylglycinamide formyltransferase-1
MRILVCCSGGGSNFESLVRKSFVYQSFEVSKLLVDRKCSAINLANDLGVEYEILGDNLDFNTKLISAFRSYDLIVLAGFLSIIPSTVIESVGGRIVNTHPSLLPKHGGLGMYGVKVQESVLRSGDKLAGCTVHQVNSIIDGGPILAQSSIVIPRGISPWDLGGLVHGLERNLLPLTVHKIAIGEISLEI